MKLRLSLGTVLLLTAASALGCTGVIGGGGPAPAALGDGPAGATGPVPFGAETAAPAECGSASFVPRSIRALNGGQYLNSVRALLPNAKLENPFAVSDRSVEFSTSPGLRRFDFNTATVVMDNAAAAATSAKVELAARLGCLLGQPAASSCVRELVTTIGRELYREPLATAQIDKLVALFDQNAASDADAALELVVQAMLSSPRFLFRKELGQPSSEPGTYRLTSHEVASAVAFTLTDAPPDAELRSATDAGALEQPEQVRAQALRVLGTPQGLTGLQGFFGEYLRSRDFMDVGKSADAFPQLTGDARGEMLADLADTISLLLRSESPTFRSLLTTRQYVVRPLTAGLLGWPGQGLLPAGTTVPSSEPGRLGIVTHPVLMATLAHQAETNPVARGHFVLDKLLCVDIPPPPQAVMFPVRDPNGPPKTLRQTLETEHGVGTCAGCHQLMDPLGYPFERFDAIGRLRASDAGLPIDTSGTILQTGEIDGPVESAEQLLTKIAGSAVAHNCFTSQVFKYVAGAGDSPGLACTVSNLAKSFRDRGGDIPDLVLTTLQSDLFQLRGEAQ